MVSLFLIRQGDWVEMRVEDTGIGVPPEDLPHLFSRFHRGRNAAAYPGNGLGLAIVKAVMDAHGGQVTITSTGQGTVAVLRLPTMRLKSFT
jgi:two-component system sensor histidine kinase MprB